MSTNRPTQAPVAAPTIEKYIGVKEIRLLLSVTDRWLRRAIAANRFPRPNLKLGRNLRWSESAVRSFVAANTIQ